MRLLVIVLAALFVSVSYVLAEDTPGAEADTTPTVPVMVFGDIEDSRFSGHDRCDRGGRSEELPARRRLRGRVRQGCGRRAKRMLFRGYEKLARWMKNGGNPTGPTFIVYDQDPRRVPAESAAV